MRWFVAVAFVVVLAGLAGFPEARGAARVFYVLGAEPKGTAAAAKEPFPQAKPPAGPGMVLKAPDAKGDWQVSAYVFLPAQIVVRKGDDVTLHFVGINGSLHTLAVEHYQTQGVKLRRGHVETMRFKADRAGVFRIICAEHQPTMNGELIVQD